MRPEKAKKIKLLVVDVDGVMTDGSIIYGNFNDDYRRFNLQDGFGFVLLHKAGIKSAIITGKSSKALQRRAKELKIHSICQNAENKLKVFRNILKKFKLKPEDACYIGDDLMDMPVLRAAGVAVTVPQACDEIKDIADYVTKRNAGDGAIREVIELILKAQDKWQALVHYYSG
ncbi:MAG: HAD-IIIA family hydrolase [Candidatus Omnitrophica bacterium]|nr:HAD-IIIA family hydrolase [Candidatus Omnitrophota bacterium]MBU4478136.1 HAD-IIIA family hydrolase [Candidatus Omnitrophota bacterium]MCG2704067.1 HAD-IIIA family hydrolase [Candidatus Omnitrophota bacterium]